MVICAFAYDTPTILNKDIQLPYSLTTFRFLKFINGLFSKAYLPYFFLLPCLQLDLGLNYCALKSALRRN